MTRKRKRPAVPAPSRSQAPDAPQAAPHGRYDWKAAFTEYFSGGLGLRANIILGTIALLGLALFVQTSIWGPDIGGDGDAPPGPTVFPTATPAP